ncbi:hypothetical protein E2C01_072574 [Portunus trituberculatus]|uniref:Uncharacterized protein n=1 Tax=Portunus trituberculatus TaxID=210409 RepID=A0A5B7I878_PORTR|nr:hypothetical protein [Portunus trituberculatus]
MCSPMTCNIPADGLLFDIGNFQNGNAFIKTPRCASATALYRWWEKPKGGRWTAPRGRNAAKSHIQKRFALSSQLFSKSHRDDKPRSQRVYGGQKINDQNLDYFNPDLSF